MYISKDSKNCITVQETDKNDWKYETIFWDPTYKFSNLMVFKW